MDYLSIGSNGFAQVGDQSYYEKMRVEMQVLMESIRRDLPIPEKFATIIQFRVKSFPHDFGTYHEIVIIYNDEIIDKKEKSEYESDQEFYLEFWDFVHSAESYDLESESLTEQISLAYQKTLKVPEQPKSTVQQIHLRKTLKTRTEKSLVNSVRKNVTNSKYLN